MLGPGHSFENDTDLLEPKRLSGIMIDQVVFQLLILFSKFHYYTRKEKEKHLSINHQILGSRC